MELGEIVYCNLKLKTLKNKRIELKEVVFAYDYESKKQILKWSIAEDRMTIRKTGLQEDLIIEEIDVIKSLGFKNKSKEYTEVKQSNEKRNKITGAYE